jgi:hypothetical protein
LHQFAKTNNSQNKINQAITMNIHQTTSAIPHKYSISGNDKKTSLSNIQKLSVDNIRDLRQHFEQGSSPLRSVLGENQHQTMMVAMYEGTEKLLNQDVSEFAVFEYLEGLKLTAKELRQQGISGEQFRSTLLEHSVSTVRELVRSS